MLQITTAAEVLGAMITPAVLISASGTLVLSTSNRLVRVVDRVRAVSTEIQKMNKENLSDSRLEMLIEQLPDLSRRLILMRTALSALYFAIGLLVLTSIMVGFVQLFHWETGNWLGIACGLLGTSSLLYASVLLVREANIAVASTFQEMDHLERSIR
ncbi:DUF2721 domain-containing protein [Deinococcus roseus]|uniref:DUF2721 domain-containing protein n=1 Tax=Deinococcus roseus TaxID=392414 RepID=A0ABQ2CVN1_9DEIO|nr:DUF2721 domain-containing protein [Deinococcus roseus]GGJ25456.1 hypothetical protein GCM10008938_09440 [Deinococcus roseus]